MKEGDGGGGDVFPIMLKSPKQGLEFNIMLALTVMVPALRRDPLQWEHP